jgi:hypothetical protein
MKQKIPKSIKQQVIKQWLQCTSRSNCQRILTDKCVTAWVNFDVKGHVNLTHKPR